MVPEKWSQSISLSWCSRGRLYRGLMVSARITKWDKAGQLKLDLSQRGQGRVPMILGVKKDRCFLFFVFLSWSSSLTHGGPSSRNLSPDVAKDDLDLLEDMILSKKGAFSFQIAWS